MNRWKFYVLECSDCSYYAGVTPDVNRRVAQHNDGMGSAYVAYRRPAKLRFVLEIADMDRSYAQKIEARFKRLSRDDKERFMQGEGRAFYQVTAGSRKWARCTYDYNGAETRYEGRYNESRPV